MIPHELQKTFYFQIQLTQTVFIIAQQFFTSKQSKSISFSPILTIDSLIYNFLRTVWLPLFREMSISHLFP